MLWKDDRREERARENRREDRPQPRESKPLNYVERAKIAKERKEQARKSKLEEVQERRRTIERKSKERELRKERLTKTTKKGQPLMGPRINNLLDKIRKDLP
jgi:ATPase subunit of ABC transporter with duplicated ATPase domains